MKSVIMAGGEGSRLRPLTCDTPKPMVRLCGRPILCYILDLLASHGVDEASVTIRYLPDVITDAFEDGVYGKIRLNFVEEETPLGTAGGVKNAASGFTEPFVVISGDALCDFDLSAAARYQKLTDADAVILTTRVEDPREYGLVTYEADGRVTGFLEKPGWPQAHTDTANTGIYFIKPEVLELIPEDQPFDFAKDLFPLMLQRGMNLRAFETRGYWCDIGDLTTFRSCHADLMNGRVSCRLPEPQKGIYGYEPPSGNYTVKAPVYFGSNVSVADGAVIGPNAVLDDGTVVGLRARVSGSVLMPDSYVGEDARLTGAILASGVSVKKGASLFENSVAGCSSVIGSHARVAPGVLIWPGKRVEDGSIVSENYQYGSSSRTLFSDEGITGETGVEITPELCVRLGSAAGSLHSRSRIGLASDGSRAARVLKASLAAGIMSTGTQVWDFGEMLPAQMQQSMIFSGMEMGIHVAGGPAASIRLFGEGGLPLLRSDERSLESRISKRDFVRAPWNSWREIADMRGMQLIYQQELYSAAPNGLSGVSCRAACENKTGERLLHQVLQKLGCDMQGERILQLSPSGGELTIIDPRLGVLNSEKVLALCCLIAFRSGNDVALCCDAPGAIDRLAERFGRKVFRYYASPVDQSDKEARRLACARTFPRDGMLQAVMLLAYLKETETSLYDLIRELPEFATKQMVLEVEGNPAGVMSAFRSEKGYTPGEGVTVTLKRGKAVIRPEKRGKQLKVIAEAASQEIAEELCAELSERIQKGNY